MTSADLAHMSLDGALVFRVVCLRRQSAGRPDFRPPLAAPTHHADRMVRCWPFRPMFGAELIRGGSLDAKHQAVLTSQGLLTRNQDQYMINAEFVKGLVDSYHLILCGRWMTFGSSVRNNKKDMPIFIGLYSGLRGPMAQTPRGGRDEPPCL